MGFIGYSTGRQRANGSHQDEVVRIFLECRDESHDPGGAKNSPRSPAGISYSYAVDVVFPHGQPPCRLRGVIDVLALKKFYKLVHSLEERAREHGNTREKALGSKAGLLEHLGYTRNARDLTGIRLVSRLSRQERGTE